MNIEKIGANNIVDLINVKEQHFIHVVPDFNSTLIDHFSKIGLNKSNLYNVFSQKSIVSVGNKNFQTKDYLLSLTGVASDIGISKLSTDKHPKEIPQNKYTIIDHSALSIALTKLKESYADKQILFIFVEYMKRYYSELKKQHPNIKNSIFFALSQESEEDNILNPLSKLKDYNKSEINDSLNFFDDSCFISVNLSGDQKFYPILMRDKNSNIVFIQKNISIAKSTIVDTPTNLSSLIEPSSTPEIKSPADIVDLNQFNQSLEIDQVKLSKILKNIKIDDPVLIANIKSGINGYMETIDKDKRKTGDIENIVLKSIHYTIYGNANIPDEMINNPEILVSKLEGINSFSQDINFPKVDNGDLLSFSDISSISKVSGPVRHEYEFGANLDMSVRTLFDSLSKKALNPIKVLNMSSTIKDDNLNRFKEYKITLQNLSGGHKEPYDINIRVPALVNGKYFKLNGNEYIMASQQILNPISKDKPNEVRLLTHYNIILTRLVNIKHDVTDLNSILIEIKTKHPKLVQSYDMSDDNTIIERITFDDESVTTLSPYDSVIYKTETGKEVVLSGNEYILREEDGETILAQEKNEFLYEEIERIMLANSDKVGKIKKSRTVSYIELFVVGVRIPIILFFWQQLGLLNSLNKFGINYKILDEDDTYKLKPDDLSFSLKNDKKIVILPSSKNQILIANGLLVPKKLFDDISSNELGEKESIYNFISKKYGSRRIMNLDLAVENFIDPTTKKILEFQNHPTKLLDLLSTEVIRKLFNDKPDHPNDLYNYRVRQSEVMSHILYNEISMAMTLYRSKLAMGDNSAKLFINPDYVIDNIMGKHSHSRSGGGGIVEYITPFNPVGEVLKASKVTRSGIGGIPSKRSYRAIQRTIHPSTIGTVASHSTSEYADVGILLHHTLGPVISNTLGSYGSKITPQSIDNFDSLAIDEALIPFLSSVDSGRLIIARTHISQKVPIKNGERALIETGAEYIVPQLASTKFLHRAKNNGVVSEVKPNKHIIIKYVDGTTETLNTSPRYSTTARNSVIRDEMVTLQPGDKFKKDQMVAWTGMFDGSSFVSGINLKVAIMNYLGYSYEDAYVLSEAASKRFVTPSTVKISVIVPKDTRILKLISEIGTETDANTTLVEFEYEANVDDYISSFDLDNEIAADFSDDESKSLTLKAKKSIKKLSPGGKVVDIFVKLNNVRGVDKKIIQLWTKVNNDIKSEISILSPGDENGEPKIVDNLNTSYFKVGDHSFHGNKFDGALIEFYIDQTKKLNVGDKLSNRYGGKGIINHLIKDDDVPRGESTGNIDIFISPISIFGRKNIAVLRELYIGKILYTLNDIVTEKVKSGEKLQEISKLILSVYDLLDPTKGKRIYSAIEKSLKSFSEKSFKDKVNAGKFRLNIIIPPFAIPKISDIEKAAKVINLELDEYVYLPELKTWTKEKVPVGIQYISPMEQFSDVYESTRSIDKYVSATGQPTKGKSRGGGQSFGNLDVMNMLTYDADKIMHELMRSRSDNIQEKRLLLDNLRKTGESDIVVTPSSGKTKQLLDVIMTGMGLFVRK